MRPRLCCLALVLTACGDGAGSQGGSPDLSAPVDVDPHSGSRLKLSWFVYTDGTRQWNVNAPFYDAARGENCTAQTWADGNLYCTPDHGVVVYSDDGCTQPFGGRTSFSAAPGTPDVPSYASDDVSACGELRPQHLFRVDPGTTMGTNSYYYKLTNGSCLQLTGDLGVYALGEEVLSNELVQMTTGTAHGSRLHVEVQRSDDGMSVPIGVRDDVLGSICQPYYQPGASNSVCILPEHDESLAGTYFTDSSCTDGVLGFYAGCLPTTVSSPSNDRCPHARQLGTPLESGSFFEQQLVPHALQCAPATTSNLALVRLGDEVPQANLQRSDGAGSGQRLQPIRYAGDDFDYADYIPPPDGHSHQFGLLVLPTTNGILRDNLRNTDCSPFKLADGQIRCIPLSELVRSTPFVDPQCQTYIVGLVRLGTVGPSCQTFDLLGTPRYAVFGDPSDPTFEVDEVGPLFTGSQYLSTTTGCQLDPSPPPLYQIGPAVPLSDFLAATTATDP